jgi:hypothetical protein
MQYKRVDDDITTSHIYWYSSVHPRIHTELTNRTHLPLSSVCLPHRRDSEKYDGSHECCALVGGVAAVHPRPEQLGKSSGSSSLRIPGKFRFIIIWVAYLGSDALAIYALATLFSRHKNQDGGGSNNSSILEVASMGARPPNAPWWTRRYHRLPHGRQRDVDAAWRHSGLPGHRGCSSSPGHKTATTSCCRQQSCCLLLLSSNASISHGLSRALASIV